MSHGLLIRRRPGVKVFVCLNNLSRLDDRIFEVCGAMSFFSLVRNEPSNGWTVHLFVTDKPDWVLHLNLGLFPVCTLVMFIRFAV